MKIYLGSDHRGYHLKEKIKKWLSEWGYVFEDLGVFSYHKDDDYPDFVSQVSQKVSHDPENSRGIVLGLSGQGEAIVANKFKGVRAAVYYGGKPKIIELSRKHNNSNILSLGAGFLKEKEAKETIKAWLQTKPSNLSKHNRRLKKIQFLEEGKSIYKKIFPAILTKDSQELKESLEAIQQFTDWVHIDIADGKFVPNTTIFFKELYQSQTKLNIEVHLMVFHPEKYIQACKEAGIKRVIFHAEAIKEPQKILHKLTKLHLQNGIALNPGTSLQKIKPLINKIQLCLLMGVSPGFQGQKFIPQTLRKIQQLKKMNPQLKVGVDGGVHFENIKKIARVGVEHFVVGSALMRREKKEEMFHALERKIWT